MGNDAALISRVQSGDRDAFAVLYGRYFPMIWRYVHSQLRGDDAASRDVVSETFLAAVQGVGRLDAGSTHVAAWLSGVARHKLADHWRRPTPQAGEQELERVGREDDPAAAMGVAEIRVAVSQAMGRMDDTERLALEWKYIEGLTVREIADRLGRTAKAVEGILYRARTGFRTQYQRITRSVLGEAP